MKFELDHLSKGKQRNLKNMYNCMISLLKTKRFEDIQVKEFCELCLIPKATFYNYFEDKYDLLDYCFDAVRFNIIGTYDSTAHYDPQEMTMVMLKGIENNRDTLKMIIRFNPIGSEFYWRLDNYLSILYERIYSKFHMQQGGSSLDMNVLARIGAHTFLTVLYWGIENNLPAEEIGKYLQETAVAM